MAYTSPAFLLHKLITEMDKVADGLLRRQFTISYKRFHFLLAVQQHDGATQHELATTLGYSDAAVSTMVQTLTQEGFITVQQSANHARKRLVTLSPKGIALTTAAGKLLQKRFASLMQQAGVDAQLYANLTQQLIEEIKKMK